MSQNTLTMPDTLMEKLHCSVCNGYLSCGPVRVLRDGSCICGQCSPLSNDSSIYRVQAFEAVLENVSFPCRFAQHGCAERLVFGQTAEHEFKCEYRSFACPSQGTACCWKGSTSKMLEHFTEAHPEQVVENADLKLQVDQNSDGVILVPKENVLFIIKYQYKAEDNHLTYDIRFCKNDSILGASYKLRLINDSDPEYTFILKTVECSIYDDTFYGIQNTVVLNLKKYLDVLDNPSCILISVNLTIISYNIDDDSRTVEVLLDSLRCTKCRNYLVAPLFLANENVICCNCSKSDDKPLNDTKLLQLVEETNFPCRWRNCEFVAKNETLVTHELECQFRQHTCFLGECDATFPLSSAINHYKAHDIRYMNNIIFKISFKEKYQKPQIFTIRNNVIMGLQYFMNDSNSSKTMDLLFRSTNPNTIANIHFEHQHCKVKSNPFKIANKRPLKITLSELPPCFKEKEKLTGILNI